MQAASSRTSLRTAALVAVPVLILLALTLALRSGERPVPASSTSREGAEAGHRSPRITALSEASARSSAAAGRSLSDRAEESQRRSSATLPLRGPSGALASASGDSLSSAALSADAAETTEARHERWKKAGLHLVPVRIVDVTSRPLEGVRVQVDNVHCGQPGNIGTATWQEALHGPPPYDITNGEGRAWLASPVTPFDLEEVAGIAIIAGKSGYEKRRIVMYPVDGSERDEVLKRGNSLTVAAYRGTPEQRVIGWKPELSWSAQVGPEDWISLGDSRLRTDAVSDGNHVLTVEYRPPDGTVWHSDPLPLEIRGGESREVEVELKAALTLRGRLSDNVPRPVTGGRVVACSQWPPPGSVRDRRVAGATSVREASATVAEDGAFEITGLPEGPGEIIGLCDGFIASHRDPSAPVREQNQRYNLLPDPKAPPLVLEMEPAGALRVRALDKNGNPLTSATLSTWPNVFWSNGVTGPYGGRDLWHAQFDGDGLATIRNLRAGKANFDVTAKGWSLPVQVEGSRVVRKQEANIVAGQTTEVTVNLEPSSEGTPGQ